MPTYTTTNRPISNVDTLLISGNSGYNTLVIGLVFSNTSVGSATVTLSSRITGSTVALSTFVISAGDSYTWPKTLSVSTNASDGYYASVVYGAGITSGVVAAVTSALDQSSATVIVGFTPRGTWASGTVYDQNDIVNYVSGAGTTWVARRTTVATTSIPAENADWAALYTNGITLSVAAGTGLSGATINSASPTGSLSIDSTVATLTGTQTLTNKTLTAPVANNPTFASAIPGYATATSGYGFRFGAANPGGAADVGWFLPTLPIPPEADPAYYVSDTLVGLTATQTVTNKTLSGANFSDGFQEEFTDFVTPGSTYIIDFADGQMQRITSASSGTTTVQLPVAVGNAGRSLMVMVKMTAASTPIVFTSIGYTVSILPAGYTTSAATATDVYTFWCDGIKWFGLQTVKGYS